jgi:hypothetical protein
VDEEDWEGVGSWGPHVQEVDGRTVDDGAEPPERVEQVFAGAPVIVVLPMVDDAAKAEHRLSVRPKAPDIGPACR